MIDLFDNSSDAGEPRALPRTSPQKPSGDVKTPKVYPRNPGSRGSRGMSPEVPGSIPGTGDTLKEFRSRTKIPGLLDQRRSLEIEIERLEAEFSAANNAQEPFKQEFQAAHYALLALHAQRDAGRPIGHKTMMAGYDRRLEAGYEWHPFRQKAEGIARALKNYRDELKAVNKEIGA